MNPEPSDAEPPDVVDSVEPTTEPTDDPTDGSRPGGIGSLFEIINLELWTLTPCETLEEAEKLELGRLFLEKHGKYL